MSELSQVYAQLNQQDVEQFYAGYQWWKIQQRIIVLQAEIGTLRQQVDENEQYLQEVRPSAVALATLARLQANGIHDLDLLDRMLERGEGWLDLIMQRLDYCEQLEFIHDNYTQWCEHALEGAYDWIDSMRGADTLAPTAASSDIVDLASVEATEEMLLRKLTSEEEEEEARSLEITLKDATSAHSPPVPDIEEIQPITEEILPAVEVFENIPEDSLPKETEVIASSPIAFIEQDNAKIPLPNEAVAELDSSQIAQGEQQSPLPLQIPQTSFPVEAGEQAQELLLQDPGSAEQETESQDGDLAPALEILLLTTADAETDLSLAVQVEHLHTSDGTSYAEDKAQEPLQQEIEIPLLIETTTFDDSSLVTEEQHPEQQTVEPALALDTSLPKEVDVADNPLIVSDDHDLNQQIVEPDSQPGNLVPMEADAEIDPTTVPIEQGVGERAAEPVLILEDTSSFEGGIEADSVQVPIDQVTSQEDTSVSAIQETLLPTGADYEFSQPTSVMYCHPERSEGSLAMGSEMLRGVYPERKRRAQHDRTGFENENSSSAVSEEPHDEQPAEAVPVAVVSPPIETSAANTLSIEVAPEATETLEESIAQQDLESAPAQIVKPRGFWQWLLALFHSTR